MWERLTPLNLAFGLRHLGSSAMRTGDHALAVSQIVRQEGRHLFGAWRETGRNLRSWARRALVGKEWVLQGRMRRGLRNGAEVVWVRYRLRVAISVLRLLGLGRRVVLWRRGGVRARGGEVGGLQRVWCVHGLPARRGVRR